MTRESGRESRDVEADESHDGRRHQNIIDAGARGSAATRLTGAGRRTGGRDRERERESTATKLHLQRTKKRCDHDWRLRGVSMRGTGCSTPA